MKNIYKISSIVIFVSILTIFASSCIHNNFNEPKSTPIPIGKVLSINDLQKIYYDSIVGLNKENYKFIEESSLFATVNMDDKSGNIYKSAYIQDESRAMNLRLTQSGGLYEGDSIRIYLPGTYLNYYEGVLQLDSIDIDKNIIKIETHRNVKPEVVTIEQLGSGDYVCKLIKLENVQFKDDELGKKFANAKDKKSEDRILEDETNQNIKVRTSGYANFADIEIPRGNGDIIALASKYKEEWQLYIRNEHEIKLDNKRFGENETLFSEDFSSVENDSEITLNNITVKNQVGNAKWVGYNGQAYQYAKISSELEENISYLILPKLNIGNSYIKFKTRNRQNNGAKLHLVYSKNYDGVSSPETASWTEIPAKIAHWPNAGFGMWEDSDEISLKEYAGQIHLAFRYTCGSNQKTTYLLDDILIYNK